MASDVHDPVIRAYYAYQVTASAGFIWPVFTLFLLWNGLSFAQIGALGAVSAVLVAVLEVPTGGFADRVGRRNALAVGMAAMAASVAGFVVAETFLAFVALYALWALALSLRSGTADAWLYETLRERTDESSFTRVRGRGGAANQWGSALAMVAGGLLYVRHPTYPCVAAAVLHALGVVAVLSLPENEALGDPAASEALGVREALGLIRTEFLAPALRAFVPFVALFFAIVGTADTYIQPITVDVLESATATAGPLAAVPEAATLGVIYAGFAALAAGASYHAEAVADRVGPRRALLGVPVLVAALLLAPVAVPLLALPAFFGMKGGEALYKPLANQYLNDRTGSRGRATVLSAASLVYALVRAPLKPVAGYAADLAGPVALVAGLGAGFLLAAAALALGGANPVER